MKKLFVFAIVLSSLFSQEMLVPGQVYKSAATNYVLDQNLTVQLLNFRTLYLNLSNESVLSNKLIGNLSEQIQSYEKILAYYKDMAEFLSNKISIEKNKQDALSNIILAQQVQLDWMEKNMKRNKAQLFIEKNDAPFCFVLGSGLAMYGMFRALNLNITVK